MGGQNDEEEWEFPSKNNLPFNSGYAHVLAVLDFTSKAGASIASVNPDSIK